MIRAIVAIDEKLGMADDNGIPWSGKVPKEVAYHREKTSQGDILMGYGTYVEFKKPFHDHLNYVATNKEEELREGFKKVTNAREFLQNFKDDIWNIGGAGLLDHTLDLHDELYITQLKGDFNCTKFFPQYKDKFELASAEDWVTENGVTYRFEIWKRNKPKDKSI
jgi:dihydrofolate reductase